MKLKLPIAIGLFLFSLSCYAQTTHEQQEVEKIAPKDKHCTEIPSSFSHETLANSKSLKALQSKKIRRVELIYTRYREDEHFDQNELNEDRMYRLNQLLPRLKTDNPTIVWIEQTGAKTRAEAQQYFHGFRIYTDDITQTSTAFKRIEQFDRSNPFSMFDVDNATGGTFSHPSGTTIYIPPYAVTDQNGNPVTGTYVFSYREYRNPAEMAFSGIPMDYKDAKGTYQFNSAGMYEIRGTQNGNPLKLAKEVIVDFNCTKNEQGVHFFQLDDESGEWTLLRHDLFETASQSTSDSLQASSSNQARNNTERIDESKISYVKTIPYALVTMDEETRKAYRRLLIKSPEKMMESVAQDLSADFRLKVHPEYVEALVQLIWSEHLQLARNTDQELNSDRNNTLLAGTDMGHQYPNMVRGLNSDQFGVYNCDQIYRVENAVSFSPKYLNSETKKSIKNPNVFCLIDKNINASFSFDPKEITCNPKGQNIFLLFTEDGQVYALDSKELPESYLSKKAPVFLMKNITDQVKTSEDLKHYLSI